MKTSLLQQLKDHLASISAEEFQKEWAEIEALELEGPTYDEFFYSESSGTQVTGFEYIEFEYINKLTSSLDSYIDSAYINNSGNSNYALAA